MMGAEQSGHSNAGLGDLVTTLKIANQNASLMVLALQALAASRVVTGSFTCANAATTTVTQPAVTANSVILVMPRNAAAGTLMAGANSLYHSANTAGASFTVATAGGGAAAGTEQFSYLLFNPV